jgi:nitroimidazol reductase NimA-like FMN-containing flavoprotein (pyridoxamine 5'-phosphate oxidase superfamily)
MKYIPILFLLLSLSSFSQEKNLYILYDKASRIQKIMSQNDTLSVEVYMLDMDRGNPTYKITVGKDGMLKKIYKLRGVVII